MKIFSKAEIDSMEVRKKSLESTNELYEQLINRVLWFVKEMDGVPQFEEVLSSSPHYGGVYTTVCMGSPYQRLTEWLNKIDKIAEERKERDKIAVVVNEELDKRRKK